MPESELTEATIRGLATSRSFERGQDYYRTGAVWHLERRGDALLAEDAGRSKHYHHAVRWLAKARQAYEAAGRLDEWRAYLEDLIVKHNRKYSLRPQLEALRR